MLKKTANIGLIILLLISTMGVTFYRHYCGTSLVKESISILPRDCCKGHCDGCHNEVKQIKITDDFEVSDPNLIFKTSISKIFNQSNDAISLLIFTLQEQTNYLYYKGKTCEFLCPKTKHNASLLQVFRI